MNEYQNMVGSSSPKGPPPGYNPNLNVTGSSVGDHGAQSGIGPERTTYQVFNPGYHGKTYSVKYLGIVDGTMGILSRKMALQGAGKDPKVVHGGQTGDYIA